MSPASFPGMAGSGAVRSLRGPSGSPGDTLVPLLPLAGGAPDPVALSTWYLALASAVSAEVRFDLFALWLFPGTGGAVLIGPEALAQDHLLVPEPRPLLLQDQLYGLEEVLRRARYPSAIAVPVRVGSRDAGVMLLGGFERGAYGPGQAIALSRLAAGIASTLGALAERMSAATPHPAVEPAMSPEALPEHLARASCEAADGPDLVRRASGILYPLLPHDRLEILIAGPAEGSWSPLSGQLPRRRWSPSGGAIDPLAALTSRFDTELTLLVDDLTAAAPDAEWSADPAGGSQLPVRGVVGSRLVVAGRTVGFLILGSVARDAYRPDDEELVAAAASFLAPRTMTFLHDGEREERRVEAAMTTLPPLSMVRAASALAQTAHLGAALHGFMDELRATVPHDAVAIHLRWGDDEIVAIDPASLRPLADLPALSLETFPGAPVLRSDREWMARSVNGGEEILVPLRVAGRPVGTLGIRSAGFADPREAAAAAQPFADLLAPHLELLRRGAAPALIRPSIR